MAPEIPPQIGAKIRQMRVERGFRRAEMARSIRCHPKSLQNIERGERNPSEVMLHRIANFFGVKVQELLAETKGAGRAEEPIGDAA